jgi:hypothetical protein
LQTQYTDYKSYSIGDLRKTFKLGRGPGMVGPTDDNSIVIIGNDLFSSDSIIMKKVEEDMEVSVLELKEDL